jgi:hypothetical protein
MDKNQQRYLIIILLLGIFLIPIFYYALNYRANPFNAEFTKILYESPPGGEIVNLNQWYFGEVVIEYPTPGLKNHYSFEFTIIDWQECPEPLEFWQGLKPLTGDEFAQMNETERSKLFSNAELNIARDHLPGISSSNIETVGTHVWTTRFVYQDDYSVSGTFKVHIKLLLLQIEA